MAQQQRLSIDKQLDRGWLCLYEIEVIEDMTEEAMLQRLERAGAFIDALRARKRLSNGQREKLINLEKWYHSYDLKSLQKSVRANGRGNTRRKAGGGGRQ